MKSLQNFVLWQFQAFDFRMMTRNEPFSQLFHCLHVYPLTVNLSRKRNLFIKVEMRKDDADIRKQPLEVCIDETDLVRHINFSSHYLSLMCCCCFLLIRLCIPTT